MKKETTSSRVVLSDENSIDAVVNELTLLEKAKICGGRLPFETHDVERLGIPKLTMADGHNGANIFHLMGNYVPHAMDSIGMTVERGRDIVQEIRRTGFAGLRALVDGNLEAEELEPLMRRHGALMKALVVELGKELPDKAGLPSCFPTGIVMGATWDPELVGECARAVAKEARAFGMDIILGPNVNIHRSPLGGRVFESFSEDPFHAGQIAVGYIQGLQEEGVAAVVKHFVANNQEEERIGIDERISERALQEIYYPAFKTAVQQGGSWMVMSAYNKVNGVDCALNAHLLTKVLREQWGFKGFVVSDWGGAYDRVKALEAGNDLDMPGPRDPEFIVTAVNEGRLAESVLDERVRAILKTMLKLPAFKGGQRPAIDRRYSSSIARKVAAEGIVLLRNLNDALPHTGGRVAVFGANATEPISTGRGSAEVVSPHVVSVFEGLSNRYGEGGVAFDELPSATRTAVICIGVGSGEGSDRRTMKLDAQQIELIRDVGRRARANGAKSVVVLNVCGPVEMTEWEDEVDAILLAWMGGIELGNAVADVISGSVCPSGKLPLTIPRRYADSPSFLGFPGEFGEVVYGEGIFVGYRYYDTAEVQPHYEFGFGLSYTSFAVGNLKSNKRELTIDDGGSVKISADLTNTGKVSGKEVVQLYVHDVRSSVRKPSKELKAFSKVELAAGEKRALGFELSIDAFAHYDSRRGEWCVEPGLFDVLVGTSSRLIHGSTQIRLVGANPYAYGENTPIASIMESPAARQVLRGYLPSEAVDDPGVQHTAEFIPNTPFKRVWSSHFSHFLRDMAPEKVQGVFESVCRDLSKVELD